MADAIDAAVQAFVSFFSSEAGEALVEEAVKVVVAAGVDAAVQAVQGKPKVGATATQLQTKVGATTPRAIIMGRAPIAGTVLTPTPLKSGKDDRFASNFYALSHAGPSGVVESVIWGDDTVTFDANGNAIGKYNDNMWLFQKNGDWNQTAISYSGHAVLGSSTPSAWDSTKRARGCLTVALVVRYAAKVLGGNMQTPIFVVDANAAVLIDPRTGSPATTQAQRRNPAVWAYSWRLGWFQNSKRVIGMGQASGELHAAGYAYAANVADANGWTISGEATTADDRYAVETAILQACASTPVERNGLQSVVTSALRSSVGTITSNDLRADPKWRYNTQQSSRPTAIQTRYRSESNRWQMVEGAEVTDASWLTQDAGREKRVMVEYAYAGGGSDHVGHLAALEASNAREPLIFTLPCKQQARYAGFVGDAVTVSLPEIGLSSTKMTVQGRIVNSDGTVDYELLVETDAKYDFAAGKTSAAPSFTLQPGFDIFSVPQPGSSEWAAVAAQITSGATSLPIVRVTGSAADYSFASGVVFKIRLNSDGSPWLVSEDAPPAVTQHEFRGLTNATSYIVGVAYRGVTGVEGPVRELAAVTTGTLVAGEAGSVGGIVATKIAEDVFNSQLAQLFDSTRPMACHFSQLATIGGVQPVIVNASNVEAWNEHHLRNELCAWAFDTMGFKLFITSMNEWTGYWWCELGTKLTAYPFSHAINQNGAYWHDFAGTATVLNVDNQQVILEEAEKRGAGVLLGTSRFDDVEFFNALAQTTVGFTYQSTLTISNGAVGAGRTVTADFDTFLASDVSKFIITGEVAGFAGRAVITGFTDARNITVEVLLTFPSPIGDSLSPFKWRKVSADPKPNGTRAILSASTVGTGRTLTTTGDSFNVFQVGQVLENLAGPGKCLITGFTDARNVTVQTTEAFPSTFLFPYSWSIVTTSVLPLTGAQTIQYRLERQATLTLQLCAQLYENYGAHEAFRGFYFGPEPDAGDAVAPFARLVIQDGIGGWPALNTYKQKNGAPIMTMIAPSSPYDITTEAEATRIGKSLSGCGLTFWAPQDTTGTGADIYTGVAGGVAGIENNLAQLPEYARIQTALCNRAGFVPVGNCEHWEMTLAQGYTDSYPASIERVRRQFSQFGSRLKFFLLYQITGFISKPEWSIKPRANQSVFGFTSDVTDFDTRAFALTTGYQGVLRNPMAVGATTAPGSIRDLQQDSFTLVGATAQNVWVDVTTVQIGGGPVVAFADFGGSTLTAASGTGTGDYQLRWLKDGADLTTSPSFSGIAAGAVTGNWATEFAKMLGPFAVNNGNGIYTLQARRTTVAAASVVLDFKIDLETGARNVIEVEIAPED